MSNSKLIVSHPGVYIKDAIDALNMTQSEFAARIGMTSKNLSTIINGDSRITLEVAEKLSSFFHSSIEVWTNLQNAYDLYLKEEEKEKEEKENWEIVKLFDKEFLNKVCDIEYNIKNKKEIIRKLEDLFMVGSLRNLKNSEIITNSLMFTMEEKSSAKWLLQLNLV